MQTAPDSPCSINVRNVSQPIRFSDGANKNFEPLNISVVSVVGADMTDILAHSISIIPIQK